MIVCELYQGGDVTGDTVVTIIIIIISVIRHVTDILYQTHARPEGGWWVELWGYIVNGQSLFWSNCMM